MKKVLAIICLGIAILITYLLQADFFSSFTIAGIKPNLFIILVLLIGLFAGKKMGLIFGILIGFCLDLLVGRVVGISCIMLGIIGLLGEYLDKNFSKESKITIILMVMGSTFFYEIAIYIFNVFRLHLMVEIVSFIKILLIECIYNAIVTIILYPTIQKMGYALENTFKVKNVLTRYF